MPQSPVVAKIFWNVLDANIAKAQVEGAGVECFLADENTVTMDWALCNAVGGVKLMVHPEDLDRVRATLAEKHASETGDDDPMPQRSAREEKALDAMRAAVLGCLFFPVSVYALWLACRAVTGEGPLNVKGKRNLFVAVALTVPSLAVAGVFVHLVVYRLNFHSISR